jgi:hypothetical protein
MKSPLTIKVKITGLSVLKVNLRRKLEKGVLTNVWELVFTLPGLGTMSLEDDFHIELYDTSLPKEERKWVDTTVGELKKDLLVGKYTKKRLPTS